MSLFSYNFASMSVLSPETTPSCRTQKKINSTVICMNLPVRFNYYLTETEAAGTSFPVIHFNSSVIWSNIDFSTKVYLIALVVALHLRSVFFFLIMD